MVVIYRGTARTKDTGARMPPTLLLPALVAPAFVVADTTVERSIHFENPIPSRTGVGYSEGQVVEDAAAAAFSFALLPVSLPRWMVRSPLPLHTAARTHRLCEER